MLGQLLLIFGSIWLGQHLIHNARRFIKSKSERTDSTEDKISKRTDSTEDKISTLPDDLLVKILLLLPTKDAVSTVVLSKRWRSIWTMLPELEYRDTEYKQGRKKNMWWFLNEPSLWWFLNESMKLHKAHVLETLCVQLGPGCPIDVDVIKWIADAVDRKVRKLEFKLSWLSEPIRLPDRLYVCNTLVFLTISDKILVDVPSVVCFPCLEILCLFSVVYKYEDALVRLLSGCPILKHLGVVCNEELPLCFNPPSSVPECLLNRLEIFEWKNYKGRNGEKELVRYLLANSECLKRVGISIAPTWSSGRVKKELKSMARLSASSHLLFSTQLKFEYSIQGETQCPFKVFIEGETYDEARSYYI
ncbi:putative F-box/FBD/LRR-repeat protein At5g52460 [Arabidopsis lyrata subsp. lyrata]|uniref:putative F-box/FBD/LRR-repeat protein At5g52460 n=1 Tax=Arabidopsis lyrata subsp. lyrata TaxID=81972 RepID=UPI000A29A29E|nr:putative F-box/FBD/LRR-repeat protein At5g52460 [Arabidopsis lyrata subsp. lyrata]|eukprot:XP_020884703.1 putative F-box/FBD/LRR-repeat protein At5g52460 [Arabidopsis lyrata subsp. lyrata]